MKDRKEQIRKRLSDLLTGGKNIKAKKIYRKLIDAIVIILIAVAHYLLSFFIFGTIDTFIFPGLLRQRTVFRVFLFIAVWNIAKYLVRVEELRAERDEKDSNDATGTADNSNDVP